MDRKLKNKIMSLIKSNLPDYFIKHHIKAVVKEALWLCNFYPKADKEVVEISSWLHDITHPLSIKPYEQEDHNIASAKKTQKFLDSIAFDNSKTKKIIHCIKAHRSSRHPEPKTIEAKIVASADNLAHFTKFDFLYKKMNNPQKTFDKIKRDLASTFMLPEALEKARKITFEIEKKYKTKIL